MVEKVLVLGCGIIGLLTAKLLREKLNIQVAIYSNYSPDVSTSAGAGGLWMPFHCEPVDLVVKWSEQTLHYFLEIEKSHPHLVETIEKWWFSDKFCTDSELPAWRNVLGGILDFKVHPTKELLKGFPALNDILLQYPEVHTFNAPVANSPAFLEYLLNDLMNDKLVSLKLSQPSLQSIEDVRSVAKQLEATYVINCTGLGSKQLLGDNNLRGARGPLLMYDRKQLPFTKICRSVDSPPFAKEDEPGYIIFRGDIVVAGGAFQLDNDSNVVSAEEEERIRRYAGVLCPELKHAKLEPIKKWVGFRPYREGGIRFDEMQLGDGLLMLNNYGHGGSGWTVCYGAAISNVEKVKQHLG